MDSEDFSVLSIQSHVVHGYVGNKSATFPLQVLGFEVDALNSVHLSNHTRYQHFKGQRMNGDELADVFQGLVLNDLHKRYTHLLTGYVGTPDFLEKVGDIVSTLRGVNPNIVYLCDPVLGDNGSFYVPEQFVDIYRDKLIPLADITTPNQFEAEVLSGVKIKTDADAWKSLDWFHSKGVKTVVLSSTDIGTPDQMKAFLSTKTGDSYSKYSILMPKLGNCNFTGTGDLFAGLFLAHHTLNAKNINVAFEKTVATIQAIIKNTIKLIKTGTGDHNIPIAERELRIVQSKRLIECPEVILNATQSPKTDIK